MTERKVPKGQYAEDYQWESARLAQSLGTNEAARRLGIGAAIVRRFVAEGANVTFTYSGSLAAARHI